MIICIDQQFNIAITRSNYRSFLNGYCNNSDTELRATGIPSRS